MEPTTLKSRINLSKARLAHPQLRKSIFYITQHNSFSLSPSNLDPYKLLELFVGLTYIQYLEILQYEYTLKCDIFVVDKKLFSCKATTY
jgi:hypothetical protein